MDLAFRLANLLVLPAWFLLVFFPHRGLTRWTAAVVVPALIAIGYLTLFVEGLLAPTFPGDPAAAAHSQALQNLFANPTLADIKVLFSDERTLVVGWMHYLAFDLLVAGWIARDARRVGLRHVFIVPSLLCTLMLGPAGWLSYMAIKLVAGKPLTPEDSTSET